ncbi:MAG: hypothetical protein KJ007_07130 [Burkholderiales bacterium]|nr:hypothetical protein [Burkholderiales bacterium]
MPTTPEHAAIRRATHAAHRAVDALDARMLAELTTLYEAAAREIATRLRLAAGADDRLTIAELTPVRDQVERILDRLGDARGAMLDDALGEAARLGVAPFEALAGGALVVRSAPLMRAAEESIRFLRTFVARDGLQLSDRIWRLDAGAREAVVGAIERAIILGQSADEAARDFLARGEPPGAELLRKAAQAEPGAIGNSVARELEGAAADARRLFRTEINRAHGEAYMKAGAEHPGFVGVRYLLSPAHPEPDICDLLSEQNLYGLGKGVYPTREACPWPAHPNTLSYLETVFDDEITDADRAGKETPLQALERLSEDRQRGVLGVGKLDIFKQGLLTAGMIRAPLSAVREHVGGP